MKILLIVFGTVFIEFISSSIRIGFAESVRRFLWIKRMQPAKNDKITETEELFCFLIVMMMCESNKEKLDMDTVRKYIGMEKDKFVKYSKDAIRASLLEIRDVNDVMIVTKIGKRYIELIRNIYVHALHDSLGHHDARKILSHIFFLTGVNPFNSLFSMSGDPSFVRKILDFEMIQSDGTA